MLKISALEPAPGILMLLLEGRIVDVETEQLVEAAEKVLSAGQRLTLDFAGVTFVSRKGVTLLRDLTAREVRIVNASGFIAEQLRSQG
jgi:anti-anti-sigma regulatory factor